MRVRVPGLILALLLASPACAAGIGDPHASSGGVPALAYAGMDAVAPGEADCAAACAPKLAYAFIDLAGIGPQPLILAASTPAPLASFLPGTMRATGDSTMLLSAVRSEEPAEERLAGLVAIAAEPASVPAPAPQPRVAPAPAPGPFSVPGLDPPLCQPKSDCQ